MKQLPVKGVAVIELVKSFEESKKTVSKVAKTLRKDNYPVAETAHRLASLYLNTTGGFDGFAHIYTAIALKLTGDQRRELHRLFREATL